MLSDVSFTLAPGAIAALLGPSGCGKTTLLRLIAGFEALQRGEIRLDGCTASSSNGHLPPERRGLGMVFQDFALFPHLTVSGNVAFGLSRWPADEQRARVEELLTLAGLKGLERRYPHELSGGQQQRVALARALAPRPRLVLLDEPFSSLDITTRTHIAAEVRALLLAARTAAILVTHDQAEAFAFADTVGVMHRGLLDQWDSPDQLYACPRTAFVASFVGEGNWLPATLRDGRLESELGTVPPDPTQPLPAGPLVVRVRPEDIVIGDGGHSTADVVSREFRGATALCGLRLPSGERVHVTVPASADIRLETRISVRLAGHPLPVFPADAIPPVRPVERDRE